MSFRKRNIGISQAGSTELPISKPNPQSIPGTKPSPLTGTPTTSTGTTSLDKLLGLGAGLALGTSLLIEEDGTTDFSSALLRCYAAEGVLQGHAVFVIAPEGSMILPGLVDGDGKRLEEREGERMKIAWRYERLGVSGEERRGACNSMPPSITPIII
jgi:elongator complex protein 4